MSLADSQRASMLRTRARRLFVNIRSAEMLNRGGPREALRLVENKRRLVATMHKLAEADPAAAKLIEEGKAKP